MRGITAIHPRQRGATLVITLLMLVVITLLAIAAVNSSTVNLRIVDNMRTIQEQEAATLRGLADVLGSSENFLNPQAQNIDVGGGNTVHAEAPVCIFSQTAQDYSACPEGEDCTIPEDTIWLVRVCFSDDNACDATQHVTMSQGVRIRLTAGSCG